MSQLFRSFSNSGIATEMQSFKITGFLVKGASNNFAVTFDYFVLSGFSNLPK